METFSAAGKFLVGSLWVWGLLSLGSPEGPYAATGLSVMRALILVHFVEMIGFIPQIRRLGQPLFPNVPMVFVFGVFQLWSLRAETEAKAKAEAILTGESADQPQRDREDGEA
ncbi:MAG: hypothetical protein ACI8TX_001393 [Hyphomicrobiaceae bacterium]|jgi:uncharacterized protein YhhL (DUF1145 family)